MQEMLSIEHPSQMCVCVCSSQFAWGGGGGGRVSFFTCQLRFECRSATADLAWVACDAQGHIMLRSTQHMCAWHGMRVGVGVSAVWGQCAGLLCDLLLDRQHLSCLNIRLVCNHRHAHSFMHSSPPAVSCTMCYMRGMLRVGVGVPQQSGAQVMRGTLLQLCLRSGRFILLGATCANCTSSSSSLSVSALPGRVLGL